MSISADKGTFVSSPYLRNALSASPDKNTLVFKVLLRQGGRKVISWQETWPLRGLFVLIKSGSSIFPEDGAPRSCTCPCGLEIQLVTLTARFPSLYFPHISVPPAAPSSKSRTTVKVITMKNSTACIYGASQSSSAETGNVTSLWNVLFTRICDVARHFIFTTSRQWVHLLIWILLVEPARRGLTLMHCLVSFLTFPIRSIKCPPFLW